MRGNAILTTLSVTCMGALMAACSDRETAPLAVAEADVAQPATADVAALELLPEPFTVRAPIDPFFINQPSEMMIRSDARTDLAIQRLVTAPGPGAWHTHPGPSFAIVDEGEVMITRYTKKGCISTVYQEGDTYFEVAGEVHRATVLGSVSAVEYKVRFYTPIGQPFASPAADPGC